MNGDGYKPVVTVVLSILAALCLMGWLTHESRWLLRQTMQTPIRTVANANPFRRATPSPTNTPIETPTSTLTPTPTPTPLPQGPCASVRILMYHHVESMDTAKAQGHAALTVDTPVFASQMDYLKARGYAVIRMTDLESFLYSGTPLPQNPVLLTFDDGYDDYATDAVPVMKDRGLPSTVFVITGLMENPGYMTWAQLKSAVGSGLVLAANHTWSHHQMATTADIVRKEITTADEQLSQAGMNTPKTFAFPYGTYSETAVGVLSETGYRMGFSTVHGTMQCYGNRFFLPRIRVGNSPLSSYGL